MTSVPAAAVERRRDVGRHRVRPRGLDDDVRPGQIGRVVAALARTPEDPDVVAAVDGRIGDGPAERPVAEDGDLHGPAPRCVVGGAGPPDRRCQGIERPRSPSWCRGPWSLRSLEAPVRRRTRRSEPQGPCLPAGPPELLLRVTREGTAVHVRDYTHSPRSMQPFPLGLQRAAAVIHIAGAHDVPVPRARPARFAAATAVRA